MELTEPRPKQGCNLPHNLPLPVIIKKDGSIYKFQAVFNGFSVVIENEEDMKNVISMGYFGKANFSRSYPQFCQKTEIIRERQYNRRKEWAEKSQEKKIPKKVIVVPDSDDEIDDYFTNLEPKYQIDYSGLKESVWLGLEEAFFLSNVVKCLDVHYQNRILQPEEMWTIFSQTDKHFVVNYIAYFHFRGKNWVVKPGIKFGGDYLLYKEGPAFYHASYVVIIDVVNENFEQLEAFKRRSLDNVNVLGLNRLCETAGKELLVLKIMWPENAQVNFNDLSNFNVTETIIRRWIPGQERNTTPT